MDEFKEIINEFKRVNNMGYVKGINNNLNAAGLTFEYLLGKSADSMFFPDFKNVELKCTSRFSKYDIGLFSLTFDGPYLFESNYLLEKYGENDSQFTKYKKLIVNFKINKKVLVNNKNYFELKMDYISKMIYFNIYDINFKLIEKRGFISFESIEKRLNIKLKYLALIYNSKKKENSNLFFRYYKIECYELKDSNKILKLLEEGTVKCSLLLRFSRNSEMLGKNRNKNMLFSIRKDCVDKLFDKIYKYEN